MIRLFLAIKSLLTFRGGLREKRAARGKLVAAPVAPDLLPEHVAAWRQFLGSEAGQVIWARARAVHYLTTIAASKDVFHTAHSCGKAAGFGEALKYLDSISRLSRVTDKSAPDGDGPVGSAEGEIDKQAPGEELLLELLSP